MKLLDNKNQICVFIHGVTKIDLGLFSCVEYQVNFSLPVKVLLVIVDDILAGDFSHIVKI